MNNPVRSDDVVLVLSHRDTIELDRLINIASNQPFDHWPPEGEWLERFRELKAAIEFGDPPAARATPFATTGTLVRLDDLWKFARRQNGTWQWLVDFCLEWAAVNGTNLPSGPHKLNSAEGKMGRQSPRHRTHVQTVINNIVAKLSETEGGAVGPKHVIKYIIENASSDKPMKTGVDDCDFVYWDASKERLCWRDRKKNGRPIAKNTLPRYVTEANHNPR